MDLIKYAHSSIKVSAIGVSFRSFALSAESRSSNFTLSRQSHHGTHCEYSEH
jgi:hypothetical protein